MNDVPLEMTEVQKRGRTFFVCALALLAALGILGSFKGLVTGKADLVSGLTSNGLMLIFLFLAFRGGQLSLKLIKGCALLLAALIGLLALLIVGSVFKAIPLSQAPTVANSLPVFLTTAGMIYVIWAFFGSSEVKAFVRYQQESSLQKKVAEIKRRPHSLK